MTISANGAAFSTNFTNASQNLSGIQNRIATGKNVSNAFQNGAIFAISQSISADLSGLSAGDQNLSQAQGFLSVANAAATAASNTQIQAQGTVTALGSGLLSSDARAALTQQLSGQAQQIQNTASSAVFNGINTFGGPVSIATGNGGATVTVNPAAQGTPSAAAAALQAVATAAASNTTGAAAAQAAVAPGGTLQTARSQTGNTLNQVAINNSNVQATQQFNQSIADATTSAQGALTDTNLFAQSTNAANASRQQQLAAQVQGQFNKSQSVVLTLFS